MEGKAKRQLPGEKYNIHTCERHQDLTILLKSANKKICNTCFATLKKSYFNIIAGCVLEMHWQHNMTRGFVEQNNIFLKRFQDQEQAILNLQAEITDIKNNGGNHAKPKQPIPKSDANAQDSLEPQEPPSDTKEICPEGHVAQATKSLSDLLHLQITRIMDKWRKERR